METIHKVHENWRRVNGRVTRSQQLEGGVSQESTDEPTG